MEMKFRQNLPVWIPVIRAPTNTDFWVTTQHSFLPPVESFLKHPEFSKSRNLLRTITWAFVLNYDDSFTFQVNYALQSNHF